jgi:CheY-like chemotaxis protein
MIPASTAESKTPDAQQARTLLIIEDDPVFASILARLARQHGYQPQIAATGKQGLLAAHSESPAAVVLDLMLPDIDGLQVLEQLKDNIQTRHIPVHVISAREDGQYLPLQKGAVGYLTKPAKPEDINRMFAEVANIRQATVKRVLVVEDDPGNRKAIKKLLGRKGLEIVASADGGSALQQLAAGRFDCVILDLQLPDMTGFEWLEAASAARSAEHAGEIPPIVVYTARKLTREEIRRLEAYTGSIIIKGAHSPERLLDEVTLFLHSIESSLSAEQRRIIRMQHDPNKVLNGRKIMIVDDDIRNVFALSRQLKKSGMDVVVADNGELALKKLGEHPDTELVIMDIMMPVMDGYEATRRIRGLSGFESIPIIALTARTMPEEQQKCLDAGANDYLSKPVGVDVLLTLMRVLLFKEVEAA